MKRSVRLAALLGGLGLVAALGGCESEVREVSCSCGRQECTVSPPDEYLFAFSDYCLREIAVGENKDAVYLSLLGDGCIERGREILNSFMPQGEPVEAEEIPSGSVRVQVTYYDMYREFYLEGDSITINKKKYTGKKGSLDPFYELIAE